MTTAPAKLPGSLDANRMLGQWLRFDRDGFVEIRPGKVEIGQGILTVLAQIAADELGVRLDQIRMIPATTASSPNEGVTAGSVSVQDCGTALRFVAAETREIFRKAAATRLGVAAIDLRVEDGRFVGPGNLASSYWELADPALLARESTASVKPKPAAERRISGAAAQRLDIPDKAFGRARLIHDRLLDGVLHGRIVRPNRPGAQLVRLDETAARALPGVMDVMRDGNFVGVIADTERAARLGAEALAKGAAWDGGFALPGGEPIDLWLKRQPAETTVIDETGAMPAQPARTITRRYTKPFLAHGSIGPCCAVARWDDGRLDVTSHSQGIYNLRSDLATAFGLAPDAITVTHGEGAGCYGHNGADDVALDAALLARAVPGRAVRVLWSRAEELAWSPMSPGMAVEVSVDLDADGAITGWRHEIWSNGHSGRPGRAKTPTLLAASQLAKPFPRLVSGTMPPAGGGGADRNSVPAYAFPARRVVSHRVTEMPLRTSAMRSLGAFANVFAIESTIDEIARERGHDPVAFRLALLPDARARAVVEAAAARADWAGFTRREGRGHGIAYARYKNFGAYCAVVAEVEAEETVRVTRLVVAVDVGEVINPDGVANQLEGGAIQATSWTLKEAVVTEPDRIVSDSWETYPILRFSEVPDVVVEIVSRPDEKALGAGEAAQGPVAGAIANAVYDALGVRVRDLPMTPDRIVSAMM